MFTKSKEVIDKEISGYEILNQLLNAYGSDGITIIIEGNMSNYDKLLLNAITRNSAINQ